MAVTIKDVAKYLGVNVSTVSRALSGHPGIRSETKERVQEAAKALGYVPSASAQTLANGRSNCIGVIFPPVENKANQPFYMKMLTAIIQVAREARVTVSVAAGHTAAELQEQVELMYSTRRVDGFIVLYAGKSDLVRDYLQKAKVPFVLIGTPLASKVPLASVDNDNIALGAAATEYLANLNHKQLGFVTDTYTSVLYKERLEGFIKTCESRHLEANIQLYDEETIKFGKETALVVMSDVLALQVVRSLEDQGKKVPDDMSVVCFNDSLFTQIFHPYLTSFDVNITGLSQAGVEELLINIKDKKHEFPLKQVIVPFEVNERESTRRI